MELWELKTALENLYDEHGLEDEGCIVRVNGREVIAAEWNGNTTIELILGE